MLTTVLLDCLLAATRQGKVNWSQVSIDEYLGICQQQRFQLTWNYLFDFDDMSIDRQSLTLWLPGVARTFVWGTKQICTTLEILACADVTWAQHLSRIHAALAAALVSSQNSEATIWREVPMIHIASIELLSHILAFVRAGKCQVIRNRLDEDNSLTIELNGCIYSIQLLFPSVGDVDTHIEPIARLTLHGASLDFPSGTEGYAVIEEVLAEFSDVWRNRVEDIKTKLLKEIGQLTRVMSSED
jgi:hypothetical protein